ncbi:MAG: hypothetical protein JO147_05775 [Actinobacteria bacterium]|nr:hypothetical protein [Actinomycetota bacterium]
MTIFSDSAVASAIRFVKMQHEAACSCGAALLIGDRAGYERHSRRTLCLRCAYREVELTDSPR